MKKKLMPQTVAPVQRESSATVSRDGGAIAPSVCDMVSRVCSNTEEGYPFAGDDAQ